MLETERSGVKSDYGGGTLGIGEKKSTPCVSPPPTACLLYDAVTSSMRQNFFSIQFAHDLYSKKISDCETNENKYVLRCVICTLCIPFRKQQVMSFDTFKS